MGNTLQDQLLKAGLANKKQAVRAKKAKNNKEKLKRHGVEVEDEAAELVRIAEEKKQSRDKALNQQQLAVAEHKAIQAQIRQIVEWNRISERGDVEFRYTDNGIVKTLMVEEQQRLALVRGSLAIINMDGQHDIVPRKAAEKISQRNNDCVLVCNEKDADQADVEDEYAEFKVPDDLMW